MTAQLDLDFNPLAPSAPAGRFVATANHVQWFIDRLRGGDWVTSTELGATTESQKRRLRLIKNAAAGAIVSWPGAPGYKLLNFCTLEELRHGDRAMRSQLREMAANYKHIWRRMHQLQLVEVGAS